MLIAGLIVAAIGGALYMMQAFGRSSTRMAIGSGAAALGAAVTPLLMDQCGFAAETSGVDHLFAYGLMAGGAWLALVLTKAFFGAARRKRPKMPASPARSGPAASDWDGGFPGRSWRRR